MKKLFSLFLVALVGGASALFVDRFFFVVDDQPEVSVTIPHRPNVVPAALAGQVAAAFDELPDFVAVADMTVHAVVHIRSEFERQASSPQSGPFSPDDLFEYFFGPRQRPSPQQRPPATGSGSGVILSGDGYVITNNHVVSGASRIEVTLNDNRMYEAVMVGSDPTTDLALLKIEEEGLSSLTFGDSDAVRVGEWVLAVGNPFNLNSTVTAGIVSAKGRNINILPDTMAIESFIQTDAAVNPGNSGGALVNNRGELIGINTAIASTTGSFAGYSFAVPSNIARKVIEDLMEYGEVQRGLLGVVISELSSRRAEEEGLSINRGAFVESVNASSAAEEAGLKPGDVIIGIDQVTIDTPSQLIETVGRKRPGDEVLVRYYRNGRQRETRAVLRNIYGEAEAVTREKKEVAQLLGARFESITEAELQQVDVSHGVRVVAVGGGAFRDAGIRNGFILTHIAGKAVEVPQDVIDILADSSGGVLLEGVYSSGRRAYYGIGLD